jgi:hypothetical protein
MSQSDVGLRRVPQVLLARGGLLSGPLAANSMVEQEDREDLASTGAAQRRIFSKKGL